MGQPISRMVTTLLAVAAGLFAPIQIGGQVESEVTASIKPNQSGEARAFVQRSPGLYAATNYVVRTLILNTYEVQPIVTLLNVPSWAVTDRFDITAKYDAGAANGGNSAERQMLKLLLAQRFNLVLHKETRTLPIYDLVTDRRDSKLGPSLRVSTRVCQPNTPTAAGARPCGLFGGPPEQMQADAVTMAQIARLLSGVRDVQRVVVDRTGLGGKYDLDLRFTQEISSGDPDAPPSIFTALKEQLGLQLRSDTGPVEVTVIDRLDKPTPD